MNTISQINNIFVYIRSKVKYLMMLFYIPMISMLDMWNKKYEVNNNTDNDLSASLALVWIKKYQFKFDFNRYHVFDVVP